MKESPEPPKHPRLVRLAEKRERHRERHLVMRAGVVVAGVAIFLLGLALIPLPGPGGLVCIGGLILLSLEFVWAERPLAFFLASGERLKKRLKRA